MLNTRWILIGLAFIGCEDDPLRYDYDGDGWANWEDCDPYDPEVYPGAPEQCDGKDNNCNGLIDDGITKVYHADADGDGFGDPRDSDFTCAPEEGWVEDGTDCDDTDPNVYPDAIERCDGKDTACNGRIDEPFVTMSFEPGEFDREQLALVGAASLQSDGLGNTYVELTTARQQQRGGAFITKRIAGDRWFAQFRVRADRTDGGDGIAFAFLKDETPIGLGPGGPNLGLYRSALEGWAVEFDTRAWGDFDEGLDDNHVALHEVRAGKRFAANNSPPPFANTAWHFISIDFNEGQVEVEINNVPALSAFIEDYDAEALTLGFTATTLLNFTQESMIDDLYIGCKAGAFLDDFFGDDNTPTP